MTPTQIEQAARERYNAVGETFWSQSEMLSLIYAACLEISIETKCIERTYTTTTVASTQEYAFPTNTLAIKRVTYNGKKLMPITFREDDVLTLDNQSSTSTGTPQYYAVWNSTLILRPIPDAAQTLKIYSINEAQSLTIASTLEVPSFAHMRLVNYVVSEMYAKDKDFSSAAYYKKLWEQDKLEIKRWLRKTKRTDSFTGVQDDSMLANTVIGVV
jgi:hypothetical protein